MLQNIVSYTNLLGHYIFYNYYAITSHLVLVFSIYSFHCACVIFLAHVLIKYTQLVINPLEIFFV